MIRIGTVTGQEIRKNRDGTKDVVLLQVEVTDGDDIQTVEMYTDPGSDCNPPNGSKVIMLDLGSAFKVAVAVDDGIEPGTSPGEKILYSTEAYGVRKAFIHLRDSGIIELNGAGDFAVRFDALNTALQQFVTDVNTALAGKQDGSGTAGTLTLDISGSKVDEVKLP